MSRGRHAKPSSVPSASTLAAAAPAVLVLAAAAPGTGHQAAPAARAGGTAVPAASADLSPSGATRALPLHAARVPARPRWVMATVQVRAGDSLSTLARRYYHHGAWPACRGSAGARHAGRAWRIRSSGRSAYSHLSSSDRPVSRQFLPAVLDRLPLRRLGTAGAAVRLSPGCPASRFQQVDDLIILK